MVMFLILREFFPIIIQYMSIDIFCPRWTFDKKDISFQSTGSNLNMN